MRAEERGDDRPPGSSSRPPSPQHWREGDVVESSGFPVLDHCRSVADAVGLDGRGRVVAVSELRTIAFQAKKLVDKGDMKHGHARHHLMKVLERLEALAAAIEERP